MKRWRTSTDAVPCVQHGTGKMVAEVARATVRRLNGGLPQNLAMLGRLALIKLVKELHAELQSFKTGRAA